MKTRDRILLCALELFNEQGEPNVTTLDMANELDISPGNLYYHFKGKEALLEVLIEDFLLNTRKLLNPVEDPDAVSPEDLWLLLHLLFEAIATYRFLFQDLSNLMSRYPFVRQAMHAWLYQFRQCLAHLLDLMRTSGQLNCKDDALQRLLDALCQTCLFWLDYQRVAGDDEADPATGVQQALGLLLPYLDEATEDWMQALIDRYA
ncbi:MAG: TetR/AcrR family transcriptional regulator [Halopseudomonas sp.]|uniref:TetR/AcrR family transcriptional regulator n=1 Tax=Halopseudomonas sp. TaxID=2901191 RepID=UPI003003414E